MIWLQLTSSTHSYIIPQNEQYIQGRLLTYWPMNTICCFIIPKCPPTAAAAKRAAHNYSLCHTLSFKCFMRVNLFLTRTLKRRSYYCSHFNKKQKMKAQRRNFPKMIQQIRGMARKYELTNLPPMATLFLI